MPEIGTSGLMSGDGKRGDGQVAHKLPRPSSTLPLPPSAIQSSCVAVFLFDQLVRAQQDRCRHIEAKRLGGLHIEHDLVFRSNFARSSAAISLAKA